MTSPLLPTSLPFGLSFPQRRDGKRVSAGALVATVCEACHEPIDDTVREGWRCASCLYESCFSCEQPGAIRDGQAICATCAKENNVNSLESRTAHAAAVGAALCRGTTLPPPWPLVVRCVCCQRPEHPNILDHDTGLCPKCERHEGPCNEAR